MTKPLQTLGDKMATVGIRANGDHVAPREMTTQDRVADFFQRNMRILPHSLRDCAGRVCVYIDHLTELNEILDRNKGNDEFPGIHHINEHRHLDRSMYRLEHGNDVIQRYFRSFNLSAPAVSGIQRHHMWSAILYWEDDILDSDSTDAPIRQIITLVKEMRERLDAGTCADNDRIFYDIMIAKYEEYQAVIDERREALLSQTSFVMDDLMTVLTPGTSFIYKDRYGAYSMGTIKRVSFEMSWFGAYMEISFKALDFDGNNFKVVGNTLRLSAYSGTKKLDELGIYPCTCKNAKIDDLQEKILARGRKYLEYTKNNFAYVHYTGNMFIVGYFGQVYDFNADGRIVLDKMSYARFESNSKLAINFDDERNNAFIARDMLTDDLIKTLPSFITGYSLRTKRWGGFRIDGCSDIKFNESAFDLLVLNSEPRKKFLQTICANENKFQDLIQTKAGGQIIILYGTPGTGKTLTAETLAETKKIPLYSVSVGELGTDVETMENQLDQILELASIWKAIILIDEADIFLEQRSESSGDILRNAMVGIFLRKLEYFDGILFLTTNRYDTLDPAMVSRATITIGYPELTNDRRKIIWGNLIKYQKDAFDVHDSDLDKLAELPINGRQIKTLIKNALWAKNADDPKINKDRILEVAELSFGKLKKD